MRWKTRQHDAIFRLILFVKEVLDRFKMKKGVQSQVLESSPANANLSFAFLARQMCLGVI